MALTSSLKAAAQHNVLYAPSTPIAIRKQIGCYWKSFIHDIAEKDKDEVCSYCYEQDILLLRREMNRKFRRHLTAGGFRISHAQKSLSIYIKHMWCMDVFQAPPQCPIDRRIINKMPMNLRTNWTVINTIRGHRQIIQNLRDSVQAKELAVWELRAFSDK